MRDSKIGRNDPCPCGSGKKYKNCCLPLEGMVDRNEKPFVRYSQLISTIKVKLDQHYKAQIKKIRKPLQDRFLRLCTTHNLPQEQESIFSDWLWFDMTDSEGISFGGEYIQENGTFMEGPLRDCLQALNSSYLSLYEVIGMEVDYLRVKDFITKREHLIMLKEPLDLGFAENKPLLLGRLVALPLGTVFSGMVLMLKNDDGQGEFISQHINYLQRLKPDQETTVLLKNHGEILFGLFEHASHKSLLRLNDIRVLRFEGNNLKPVSELNDSEAFCLVHESEGIRWYALHDSQSNARVGIDGQCLIAYADLLADILSMEKCLDKIFPYGKWETVNNLFLFQPPAPQMENIWYSVIKDQETERWLHTVHHELDDKTPQEVLQAEAGRDRVLALLDSFASQTSGNEYSEDLINYMRQRIEQ